MRRVLLVSLLIALGLLPAYAGVVIYTDQTAFQNALSSYSTENFTGNVLHVAGLTFTSTGTITTDLFNDRVVHGGTSTTWTLPGPMLGFGGIWDLTPGGVGQGLEFYINGTILVSTELPNTYTGQFWGFISDTSFTSVKIDGGTQLAGGVTPIAESYNVDNLVFGSAEGPPPPPPDGTPEPATFGLIGAALLALGSRYHFKHRA